MNEKNESDEVEIGFSFSPDIKPFRRYRNGELVEQGFGKIGLDPDHRGPHLAFGPLQENGRHSVEREFSFNASGSVCHSGAATREYRDGWERIFASRRKPSPGAN